LKDCIGALDVTHVRVSLRPSDQVRYIVKTGMPTQSNLAVCDSDMRFTYVSVGQPGSIHDTSVLYKAIEVDKEFFPHPPKGNIFILLLMIPQIFTWARGPLTASAHEVDTAQVRVLIECVFVEIVIESETCHICRAVLLTI
jgi:hypothetical protein